jgi:hypothetical protein
VVAAAGSWLSLVLLLGGCHFASVVTVAGGGWSRHSLLLFHHISIERKYLRTIISGTDSSIIGTYCTHIPVLPLQRLRVL